MKIFKYLLATMLIIIISKKIHVQDDALPSTLPIIATSDQLKQYNATSKTAMINDTKTYVGVIPYNQATTPPDILIPAMIPFITIPTAGWQQPAGKSLLGGKNRNTTLYGIPVTGPQITIKQGGDHTIGWYWPQSRVAQLTSGDTYVEVIEEQIGNYKELHALGPLWTRFPEEDLLKKYNISVKASNFQDRVAKIGIIKRDHAHSFTLYGVQLQATNDQLALPPSPKRPFNHMWRPKVPTAVPAAEETKQVSPMMRNLLAAAGGFASRG